MKNIILKVKRILKIISTKIVHAEVMIFSCFQPQNYKLPVALTQFLKSRSEAFNQPHESRSTAACILRFGAHIVVIMRWLSGLLVATKRERAAPRPSVRPPVNPKGVFAHIERVEGAPAPAPAPRRQWPNKEKKTRLLSAAEEQGRKQQNAVKCQPNRIGERSTLPPTHPAIRPEGCSADSAREGVEILLENIISSGESESKKDGWAPADENVIQRAPMRKVESKNRIHGMGPTRKYTRTKVPQPSALYMSVPFHTHTNTPRRVVMT